MGNILKIKSFLYLFIVLSSISFYNPFGFITPIISKFLFYFICIIAIIYAYKNGVNIQSVKYPRKAYKVIISGILISIIMVVLYQDQSLKTTVITTLPYFFGYLTFYILMKLNIPKERIEHFIWIFCYISMGVYIINMFTFPNIIFGMEKETYDMSRGIIRLGVFSIELMVLFFFYAINQWLITKKKKYFWLMLLTFTFIVLSVTRQYIFLSAVLGLLFIMRKVSWIKKIGVVIICLLLFFIVLPQIPMFKTMVELSESQVEKNKYDEEDIRIRAWKFYTYEYQTNELTAILGNGIPSIGNSNWGNNYERTVYYQYGGNGCFTVDVGWAGFYWYFGAFTTICLLYILVKATLRKKVFRRQYLTYWCVFIIITSAASGPILFHSQIISIMTVLYIIYGKEVYSCNNPQLQQL